MAIDRQPLVALQNQQTRLQAQQSQLSSLQTAMPSLRFSAQDLGSPSLFATSQTVSVSDPTKVGATVATGAGVGAHEVGVSALANSAQRTFTFASPASSDTVTIDGHDTTLAANATAQDFANAINSDDNATVWAAVTDPTNHTVVLSSRTLGSTGGAYIAVTNDPGHRQGGIAELFAGAVQPAPEPGRRGWLERCARVRRRLPDQLPADQMSALTDVLATRQKALQAQFATLEATPSQTQSQGTWLTGQITSLGKF